MAECTQAPKRGNDCTLSLDHYHRAISWHATFRWRGCDGGVYTPGEVVLKQEKRLRKRKKKENKKRERKRKGRRKVKI